MRRARRALACVVAAVAIGVLVVVPRQADTDAAFTDQEVTASTQTVTALRLAPPQITGITTCARPVLGLNNVLRVTWRWPAATEPYSQLTAENALWSVNGGPGRTVTTTEPVNGVYTTTFSGSLLGDILGGLLGQSYSVSLGLQWTTPGGAAWTSPQSSRIDVSVPLLVGAPTCTYVNGS